MISAGLESSQAGNDERFFKRHDSRTWCWRLLDLVPRCELQNAPKRCSHASPHLEEEENDLPVPLGWPHSKFTLWPTAGLRNPNEYGRGGPLLLHWSVKPLVEAGQYALDERPDHLMYVEDAHPSAALSRLPWSKRHQSIEVFYSRRSDSRSKADIRLSCAYRTRFISARPRTCMSRYPARCGRFRESNRRGRGRRDMALVGKVAGVDLKPPGPGLIADHRVEQRVVRRADGVGTVPGLADVAHAADRRHPAPQ